MESNYAAKSDVDKLSDIVREIENQSGRQGVQLDNITDVLNKMDSNIKSLEKSSHIISGAFKTICYTAMVLVSFITFRHEISSFLMSLNTYGRPINYAQSQWNSETLPKHY